MKVLGIHDGHNASAALLVDGKLVAAVQEERITRRKNEAGFPHNAVKDVLGIAGSIINDIDIIAISSPTMYGAHLGNDLLEAYRKRDSFRSKLKNTLFYNRIYAPLRIKQNQKTKLEALSSLVDVTSSNVKMYDHHLCHAATAYFGSHFDKERPVLVLTCDGRGDGLCASVNIGQGQQIKRIAEIPEDASIGSLYSLITFILGMTPMDHEYKLMGMAPYAKSYGGMHIYNKLKDIIKFPDNSDDIVWRRNRNVPPTFLMLPELKKLLAYERFDNICFGIQKLIEDTLKKWVKRCIKNTGIGKLALSGGVFMNVKANKAIMELEDVEDLFIFPSCGDETNSIGACYLAHAEIDGSLPRPIRELYLGRHIPETEIENTIKNYNFESKIKVLSPSDPDRYIAELLAKGEVVARFSGRMEFGARALGNRSILANPSDHGVIKVINEMIKCRDFWMPFAPSMLHDLSTEYIVKQKPHIFSPYMILSFDTQNDKSKLIEAAIHPYDLTARPQEVKQSWNPSYYNVLLNFHDLTGIGAVLNTSFNLHGYPIVYSPEDAIEVFENSSLKWLVLDHLIIKKES